MKRLVSLASAAVLVVVLLTAWSPPAGAFVSTGDGSWVWQAPLPEGNVLRGVACPDGQHAWAVGDVGTLLASHNGGLTWSLRHWSVRKDLDAVAFADARHGWIVGAGATVLATTDRGSTWAKRKTGLAKNVELFSVTSVGRKDLWAVGNGPTNGVVVRSRDGGKTWRRQTLTGTRLAAFDFISATRGCIAGAHNMIRYTTDGGKTWQPGSADTPATTAFSSVSWADRDHAWAAGADYATLTGYIVHTGDGGKTWQQQYSGDMVFVAAVSAVDATHAYAAGSTDIGGLVLGTIDGSSWVPAASVPGEASCAAITVDRGSHGIAVGPACTIVTSDDEDIWTSRLPHGSDPFVDKLTFADTQHGWAVGENRNTLLATSDGGAHWQSQTPPEWVDFYACASTDALHAWIVGRTGTIIATVDGGADWATQASGTVQSLWGVAFADVDHGLVVGSGGVIRYTDDGGGTWHVASTPTTQTLFGVAYRDADHAVAVGWSGTMIVTADGGHTWTAASSPTMGRLLQVCFASAEVGWVVGDSGTVYATTDGGANWHAQKCTTTASLRDVSCISPLRAWIVTDSGGIFATTDGGSHWRRQVSGTHANLFGVDFVDAKHGFVGGDGAILATTSGGWHVTSRK